MNQINQLCLTSMHMTLNSLLQMTNLWPSDSRSNWNLEMLERGKPEYPEKNLSEQEQEPTKNSTHIFMTPSPGIKPEPHWWDECSHLRSIDPAPPPPPQRLYMQLLLLLTITAINKVKNTFENSGQHNYL